MKYIKLHGSTQITVQITVTLFPGNGGKPARFVTNGTWKGVLFNAFRKVLTAHGTFSLWRGVKKNISFVNAL